jgi:hypothetical protein
MDLVKDDAKNEIALEKMEYFKILNVTCFKSCYNRIYEVMNKKAKTKNNKPNMSFRYMKRAT